MFGRTFVRIGRKAFEPCGASQAPSGCPGFGWVVVVFDGSPGSFGSAGFSGVGAGVGPAAGFPSSPRTIDVVEPPMIAASYVIGSDPAFVIVTLCLPATRRRVVSRG